MTEETRLVAWNGDEGEYNITHEDALIIRDALKHYKKKMEKEDPFFFGDTVKNTKRIRRIFKVAVEGVY